MKLDCKQKIYNLLMINNLIAFLLQLLLFPYIRYQKTDTLSYQNLAMFVSEIKALSILLTYFTPIL